MSAQGEQVSAAPRGDAAVEVDAAVGVLIERADDERVVGAAGDTRKLSRRGDGVELERTRVVDRRFDTDDADRIAVATRARAREARGRDLEEPACAFGGLAGAGEDVELHRAAELGEQDHTDRTVAVVDRHVADAAGHVDGRAHRAEAHF